MMMSSRGRFACLLVLAAPACNPRPGAPRPDRGAVTSHADAAAPNAVAPSVFTDTALFRRVCLQADSGLTPAARRCTPRDQRVVIQ